MSLWLQCSRSGGPGQLPEGTATLAFDVLHVQRKQPDLSIAGSVDRAEGQRDRAGAARGGEHVLVSGGVLQTLGVPPVAGRELTAVDQVPNGAKSVMLSYGYWQRRFGGDRSVIGRTIDMDSQPRADCRRHAARFPRRRPRLRFAGAVRVRSQQQTLAGFGLQGIGRLKPGVTIAQANADIARLIPVWMDSFSNGPDSDSHTYIKWRITPDFHSLKQEVIGNVGSVLWVVMGTIGVVLLIACINVANLLLVRAEARQLELSIRAALGAGRGSIAREVLFESVLLGLIGGVFGNRCCCGSPALPGLHRSCESAAPA